MSMTRTRVSSSNSGEYCSNEENPSRVRQICVSDSDFNRVPRLAFDLGSVEEGKGAKMSLTCM